MFWERQYFSLRAATGSPARVWVDIRAVGVMMTSEKCECQLEITLGLAYENQAISNDQIKRICDKCCAYTMAKSPYFGGRQVSSYVVTVVAVSEPHMPKGIEEYYGYKPE